MIGSDDAQLTKWKSCTIYPVAGFFLNIPCKYRHKFPLLFSFYCGPKANKPPPKLLHASALRWMKAYNQDLLEWPDGTKKKFRIIIVGGDAVEKAELLQHVLHHGKHSCFYCRVRGEVARGSTKLKYPKLFHQHPDKLRSEKQRLKHARIYSRRIRNWKNGLRTRRPDPVFGVKGKPFYRRLNYFDGLWSYVIDALHTLYEGVGSRLASVLIDKSDDRSLVHNQTIVGELTTTFPDII